MIRMIRSATDLEAMVAAEAELQKLEAEDPVARAAVDRAIARTVKFGMTARSALLGSTVISRFTSTRRGS
ncbi:hypothetical protein [Pseudooceanicola sp.]|uniref:hypothetical protein n=1 Tax=Pseudooceanicola sp. TaxID=1914328 RepID=UPI004059169A